MTEQQKDSIIALCVPENLRNSVENVITERGEYWFEFSEGSFPSSDRYIHGATLKDCEKVITDALTNTHGQAREVARP